MAPDVFDFVAHNLSPDTYVSIIDTVLPAYEALNASLGIDRKINEAEFHRVMNAWSRSGLVHGWVQDMDEQGGA